MTEAPLYRVISLGLMIFWLLWLERQPVSPLASVLPPSWLEKIGPFVLAMWRPLHLLLLAFWLWDAFSSATQYQFAVTTALLLAEHTFMTAFTFKRIVDGPRVEME